MLWRIKILFMGVSFIIFAIFTVFGERKNRDSATQTIIARSIWIRLGVMNCLTVEEPVYFSNSSGSSHSVHLTLGTSSPATRSRIQSVSAIPSTA